MDKLDYIMHFKYLFFYTHKWLTIWILPTTKRSKTRGPSFPFLFIVAAEVLSKLLQKAEERNKLKDIRLAKGCQPISHLQFADDLFIFGRADEENIRSIK